MAVQHQFGARLGDNGAERGAVDETLAPLAARLEGRVMDEHDAEQPGAPEIDETGPQVGQLSRQQKEIISATFNVNRDRAAKKLTDQKFKENASLIQLRQARLREQVDELSGKMNSRLDVVGSRERALRRTMLAKNPAHPAFGQAQY